MKKMILISSVFLASLFLAVSCGQGLCISQEACNGVSQPSSVVVFLTDLLASQMHRTRTATLLSQSAELTLGTGLPSGYRAVPQVALDDEGSSGVNTVLATRPTVACGTSQNTVAARIDDCATKNSATATWDGATNSNAGQGSWKLVTYTGAYEVWRDERTQLLWSDVLVATSWCRATGSSGVGPFAENDPDDYCDNAAHQSQVTPESLCFEAAGLDTPSTYDPQKGGMRATATATSPAIVWRVPTRWDFQQADIDGVRLVLPNMGTAVWTATVREDNTPRAWVFNPASGITGFTRDSVASSVRCIGR